METIQNKMNRWLYIFKIILQIITILLGIAIASCTFTALFIASEKNILQMKVAENTTIIDLFDGLITSRWELFAIIALTLMFLIIIFVSLILILKWFKLTLNSGDPFALEGISILRKTSKFIYISCLVGFIIELITIFILNNSNISVNFNYFGLICVGLLIHLLSYIFTYAHVYKKDEDLTIDLITNENTQTNENDKEV